MKPTVSKLSLLLVPLCCGCVRHATVAEPPVKVTAVTVLANGANAGLYYSGTIEADKNISLGFLTSGRVLEVDAREGDRVTKGQVLAKLDCQSNEDSLKIADAKAKQAEDAYNRFEPMFKNGNLPAIKMVEIETGKTQAEMALKLAQKNADDCTLCAPEDGLISARSVEPGDTAAPGMAAFRFVTIDNVYASISVPEKEISSVRRGLPATVEYGPKNLRLAGAVSDVGVSADPLSRTYNVRITLHNSGSALLPGMLCNVYLGATANGVRGIVIPATALKLDAGGGQFVYVIDTQTKRVRHQPVATEGFVHGGVKISAGLAGGETIVAEGAQKLDDNTPVEY
jgi:RND family efflux transporter MFP subunit